MGSHSKCLYLLNQFICISVIIFLPHSVTESYHFCVQYIFITNGLVLSSGEVRLECEHLYNKDDMSPYIAQQLPHSRKCVFIELDENLQSVLLLIPKLTSPLKSLELLSSLRSRRPWNPALIPFSVVSNFLLQSQAVIVISLQFHYFSLTEVNPFFCHGRWSLSKV